MLKIQEFEERIRQGKKAKFYYVTPCLIDKYAAVSIVVPPFAGGRIEFVIAICNILLQKLDGLDFCIDYKVVDMDEWEYRYQKVWFTLLLYEEATKFQKKLKKARFEKKPKQQTHLDYPQQLCL